MWITSANDARGRAQKLCTRHGEEFLATRSCSQCAGPARLNRLDANGERVDPFPELTAALSPSISEAEHLADEFAAVEQQAREGGAWTAAAAYGRLRLAAKSQAWTKRELLAEWRRIAALEERRKWSRQDPREAPGIGAPAQPASDAAKGEVH